MISILVKKTTNFFRKKFHSDKGNFYGNITLHPCMKNIKYIISRYGLNNSNIVAKNGILLPCHHGLRKKM